MLRRAAAAAVVLAGVLAPVAVADDGTTLGNDPGCRGSMLSVTVCASDNSGTGGGPGTTARPAGNRGSSSSGGSAPKCTYEKADPQPPAQNLAWDGKTPKDGAIYRVWCEGGRVGVAFVPTGGAGPAAPTIDPELVARRAADAMKLTGPKVASPRAAGKYVVGMPMWMWVTRSTSSYGPATAKATAGGVTVTATAKVSTIRWDMGDGTIVTCNGPGTPYSADRGKALSPDCGHRYVRSAADQPDGRYKGTATATWTVTWTAPALGDGGEFTETRQTAFTAAVGEVQVLN
ncbi:MULTISPECIES: ATP/GTP-binding protein [unclassified Streptomyces]|uniref:ATP/GTP-binding protein n=1 Tax=unclassified Streptomyces TaxID=2593676 RepID=UPI002253567F|nr:MULTISPECIES: ATP/GTP-binding protein [unclassified Streptomyces]MCX4871067.1 ATP/GTP-binding protein [Streptomyces sp. NBC_00906]MCX4902705.1 ATP/GTP-binding protein [Streptomyces sp. NBC_00892]